MRNLVVACVLVLSLSGCASISHSLARPTASPPTNPEIASVSLDAVVSIVNEPVVPSAGEFYAALFAGAIGAAVMADSSDEEKFVQFLEENDIDLEKTVMRSLSTRLSSPDSKLNLVEDDADVTVKLHILFYGLLWADAVSRSRLVPVMELGAEVFDREGNHFMNVRDTMKGFPGGGRQGYSMNEYRKSPDLLRTGYSVLGDKIADSLILQLSGVVPNEFLSPRR